MIPLKQRNSHRPEEGIYGDCHRAALASILELSLDDVPHFCDRNHYGDDWAVHERARLIERGIVPITTLFDAPLATVLEYIAAMNPDTYYILGGYSMTNCGHSVVGLNDKIVHDPSLNESGIVGPMKDGYYWVTFFGSAIAHRAAA